MLRVAISKRLLKKIIVNSLLDKINHVLFTLSKTGPVSQWSYDIATPALAYPCTVLTSVTPAAVAENTSSNRVWLVTGIANPVRVPLLIAPTATTPVRAGAKVTAVPATGEKMLSGVVELYSCAVIVRVVPVRVNGAVVLKKASIDVIIPARGTEKAKLSAVAEGPVRSMVAPREVRPGPELPNPTKLGVPAAPSAIVVTVIGLPDE